MELVRKFKIGMLCLALGMAAIDMVIVSYQGYKMFKVSHDQILYKNAIIKPVKVFQIGFSKCGTMSLFDFFNRNGIASVHHDGGHLAVYMHLNHVQGKPLLDNIYQHHLAFFDMERLYDEPLISIPQMYFKELDRQNPGSKFILNTRNKSAWLKSKSIHPAYHHKMRWIDLHAKFLNKSKDEVLAIWSKEWDEHYNAVLDYFKDRPDDLLVFDIENDPPQKICDFLKDYYRLNPKYYGHKNKSVDRDKERVISY